MRKLTLAKVFVIGANALAIIDERSLGVEVGRRSVGQCPMIKMEQVAVVGLSYWRSTVQVGPAEKLVLDFAGNTTGGIVLHLQLLVRVVMQTGVLGHLVVGDTDTRHLEVTLCLARFLTCVCGCQAQRKRLEYELYCGDFIGGWAHCSWDNEGVYSSRGRIGMCWL